MKTRKYAEIMLSLVGGLAMLLAGCESDFVADPSRPRPTRAVESPFGMASGNSEVMGRPTGAVPLVTVELPNTKEETAVVHTILEPAGEMVHPTTRPATRAATQPAQVEVPEVATGSATDVIKVVAQQKPADVISITRDNEANADIWIASASGIGTLTLERTGENWPSVVRVHLRYDAVKAFTRLEGFNAFELVGEDRRVALKAITDKETAKATVTIPAFARGQRMLIEWVDAYR